MKTKILASIASLLILSSCSYYVTQPHTAMVNPAYSTPTQYTYDAPTNYIASTTYIPTPDPPGITYQVFYDQLSPYGNWIADPNYGYVWIPSGGPGFTPYCTNGHWVFTEYGWAWVSAYNWGWAPYHYGRWVYDSWYGWEWVPGYEWAPAWVQWGQYNNYYGWTPLPPNYGPYSDYRPAASQWTFVPQNRINQVNITNYVVNNTTINNYNIIINKKTNTYNEHAFNSGPKREDVELASGVIIKPAKITDGTIAAADLVKGNQLVSYRPTVTAASAGVKPEPDKVVKKETLTPVTKTRTTTSQEVQSGTKTTTVTPARTNTIANDQSEIKTTSVTPARTSTIANDQSEIKTTSVTPARTTSMNKDQSVIVTTPITTVRTTATNKDQSAVTTTPSTSVKTSASNKDQGAITTTPATSVRSTAGNDQNVAKTTQVNTISTKTNQVNQRDIIIQPSAQKSTLTPAGNYAGKNDTVKTENKAIQQINYQKKEMNTRK